MVCNKSKKINDIRLQYKPRNSSCTVNSVCTVTLLFNREIVCLSFLSNLAAYTHLKLNGIPNSFTIGDFIKLSTYYSKTRVKEWSDEKVRNKLIKGED